MNFRYLRRNVRALVLGLGVTGTGMEVAFAEEPGFGTKCAAYELGIGYYFTSYIHLLSKGDSIFLYSLSNAMQTHSEYRVESVDLTGELGKGPIGVVRLVFAAESSGNANKIGDMGNIKIEYFSNSALDDITISLKQGKKVFSGEVNCRIY